MKPRRSNLSVPGHVKKMHAKAADSDADVVMLDLEDSVPLDQKELAREEVIRTLQESDWSRKTVTVRINALDTPFGYRDLLEVAESAGEIVDAIVIPKVNGASHIHFADHLLNGIEMNKNLGRAIRLEASIETAEGLLNAAGIAAASPRILTLVFGIADYSASVGARLVSISGHGENEEDLYPGHRWHYPLSRLVMAAKAHGAMAIDAPYGNFKDAAGLRRAAVMACALGCNGKWAIHPAQTGIINEVFTPTAEEIALAQKILAVSEEAASSGKGAVAVEGRMVDQATVRMARQLCLQAEYLGLI